MSRFLLMDAITRNTTMCALSNRAVSVITLGRMGFMGAYDIQMRYARQHLDELSGKPYVHGENVLLLVEHAPVYTVGVRNKNITKGMETGLKKMGAEFYKTNRGGPILFHGPGQLVAYPILNLHHFKPSLKWYACQLEKTLIATLKQFTLSGRTTDHSGILVGDRKIATIGLHEGNFITTHGVALNCNVNLNWFKSCQDKFEMTSLSMELKQNVVYKDAVKPFLLCFQDVFDCELEFKMLDENELKSMDITHQSSAGTEFGSGGGLAGHTSRAELLGFRQMSTLCRSGSHENVKPKINPMW